MTKKKSSPGSKSPRGFARDPSLARAAGSKGGKSVPPEKRSFSRDRSLAVEAGKKGGIAVSPENRSFARDHALAKSAGKKGGKSVPPEKRSFTTNRELASAAGKKGGATPRGVRKQQVLALEECPQCEHTHAGPELANVCIGCPCPERPGMPGDATPAPGDLP